jgi:hypothetical protein
MPRITPRYVPSFHLNTEHSAALLLDLIPALATLNDHIIRGNYVQLNTILSNSSYLRASRATSWAMPFPVLELLLMGRLESLCLDASSLLRC